MTGGCNENVMNIANFGEEKSKFFIFLKLWQPLFSFTLLCRMYITRWFWRKRSQGYKVTFDARFWRPFPQQTNLSWNCHIRRLQQKELCACYLVIEMKCTLVRFPTYVTGFSFGRDCKDWKYKDLKLKSCRQRIVGEDGPTKLDIEIKSDCFLICSRS